MRNLRLYILFIIGISLMIISSCIRVENPDYGTEIKLYARMGSYVSISGETRSEDGLDIGIVRLDEKNGSEMTAGWPYFINCSDALTAKLTEPDSDNNNLRTITGFNTPQFFKNSTDKIRYAAWYPQGTYTSGSSGTTITHSIDGNTDLLYSDVVEGTMSTGFDVMEFHHALSLFKIYAYSSSAIVDWGAIKSVSLSDMPNVCTITLPSGHEPASKREHDIVYSKTGDGLNLICTPESPGIDISEGFENKVFIKEWITAPASIETLKGLNISVTTQAEGETEVTKNISVAQNFQPGYAYDIILRFSDNGVVNAEVQIAEWPDGDDKYSDVDISETFYNLSANGTANCYIVSSANFSYCFDATIKGNGSTAALPGARIDPTLNPSWVDIIWSEVPETDFKLETNKIVEGKVLFVVNGNPADKKDRRLNNEGNVLLGVYDREGGNCLWTWHIWLTDKPQKQNYKKGYVALDRNLGATAPAPESGDYSKMNGLFYQWGRPTPFRLIEENSTIKVDGSKEYTRVTPDVAVANPMILYGRFENNTAQTPEGDKIEHGMDVSGNYHDWVDRNEFNHSNNLWGYREVEHVKPLKTLYDPCPHGYHVPYQRNWEEMEQYWSNNPTNKDEWNTLGGVEFTLEGNSIWYPFQGYINKDGQYLPGHIHMEKDGENTTYHAEDTPIVEVWSSLINRHNDSNRDNDSPYRFLFTRDYGAMLSDQYSNRSRGLAVRCVSDNTADVVKDLSASQTANCYMVDTTGYFKFKVTVRGNGVGSLLPLGGTNTAEINAGLSTTISPAKVDILWWQGDFTKGEEDFPTDQSKWTRGTPPENMCIELLDGGVISDGYAAFHISKHQKGNAVIAAYNDVGIILWTWHIWLTDKPEDILSGNYTKLDRFLGATFAPDCSKKPITWQSGEQQATLGFYYQWGRKDPLIGPPGISNGDYTTSSTTTPSSGWWIKNGDTWTYRTTIDVKATTPVADVVKEPTAFYTSKTSGNANTSQWFPDTFADGYTNVAMWGYAVADYSINGQTFSKTMYDPCPPGYRTPFHFSWRYSSSEMYAEGDNGEAITTLTDAEKGYDNYGIVTNKTHFHKMWFPFGGYRDPLTGNYTDVGQMGYMNTGMPMGQYNTRSFWYSGTQTGQYAGRHGAAYGKMIRCMKE